MRPASGDDLVAVPEASELSPELALLPPQADRPIDKPKVMQSKTGCNFNIIIALPVGE